MGTTAIIALIEAAVAAAMNLFSFATKAAADLKQDAELTPEQEAKLDALIATAPTQDAWKPDAS